jgi:GxxExxY protein
MIRLAREVHRQLGPGFIESIYARALISELKCGGFRVERERLIKIWYGSQLVGRHRLDMLVDSEVIIELKASRCIIPCILLKSVPISTPHLIPVD